MGPISKRGFNNIRASSDNSGYGNNHPPALIRLADGGEGKEMMGAVSSLTHPPNDPSLRKYHLEQFFFPKCANEVPL